jgi:hypothetical protein
MSVRCHLSVGCDYGPSYFAMQKLIFGFVLFFFNVVEFISLLNCSGFCVIITWVTFFFFQY